MTELKEPNTIVPDRPKTLPEYVYDWLRARILSGEYEPGEHISQQSVSDELQVSRMPVREAFKRLEMEGLILIKPYAGAVVNNLSPERMNEIYDIRQPLECLAIQKACLYITGEDIEKLEELMHEMEDAMDDSIRFMEANRRFHMYLYSLSKMQYLVMIISNLWDLTEPYRLLYASMDSKRDDAVEEHRLMLHALKKRDALDVCAQITSHHREVMRSLNAAFYNA